MISTFSRLCSSCWLWAVHKPRPLCQSKQCRFMESVLKIHVICQICSNPAFNMSLWSERWFWYSRISWHLHRKLPGGLEDPSLWWETSETELFGCDGPLTPSPEGAAERKSEREKQKHFTFCLVLHHERLTLSSLELNTDADALKWCESCGAAEPPFRVHVHVPESRRVLYSFCFTPKVKVNLEK